MELFLTELEPLRLHCLDESWVNSLLQSEYLQLDDLPEEYLNEVGEDVIVAAVRRIADAAAIWRDKGYPEWANLAACAPDETRALPALLARLAAGGSSRWRSAVAAAQVYVRLLALPGARAYGLYHSQLFTLTLQILTFPQELVESDRGVLTLAALAREVNLLVKDLAEYVQDLHLILPSLKLTPADINFEDILSNLVDITGCAIVNRLNIDMLVLSKVSSTIYEMIEMLLRDSNGQPNKNALLLLFKCFLPKLVAASSDARTCLVLVRASYVTYAAVLLTKFCPVALQPFSYLIQHLCYATEGLERADSRLVRAQLVVGLVSLLPPDAHTLMMDWFIRLSTAPKAQHRLLALEVLCNLIDQTPAQALPGNERPTNEPSTESAEVPTTSEEVPTMSEEVPKTSAEVPTTSSEVSKAETSATENASSVDSVELSLRSTSTEPAVQPVEAEDHENQGGICETRGAGCRLDAALNAVVSRWLDPAGTVRTRAASGLAGLKRAGGGDHMLLLVRDDRAAVRRAAVSLLQNMCEAESDNQRALDVLVALCRDASVQVRGAAVGAVAAVVAHRQRPDSVRALLAGPLQRLVDPENKIVEQVTEIFRSTVVERLRVWSEAEEEPPLPWMVVAEIIKHNMRRHLQRALTTLHKNSSCISERLVDVVSSHMRGSESRQLKALVLLVPLARLVPYSDTSFITDYFNTIADDRQCRDARLLPLCVEVLGEWARFIPGGTRQTLHEVLVRTLSSGGEPASRIVCAHLAANLEPQNLQWADDLVATWSSREDVSWLSCAAEVSLVCSGPPPLCLETRLLAALDGPDVTAAAAAAGRLCLRSRDAAARIAPALGALLSRSTAPSDARINALYALADMCVRYTCIVEPLLEVVCASLREDAPPELRRAAATTVTRLLLGGYLRLRAPLYYSYCALVSDGDPEVREPPEYYVTSCLPPEVIYHHIVDTLVAYTRPDAVPPLSYDDRHLIYDVMLQRLSLVQRLNVQVRLAREVLQRAVDEWEEELEAGLHAALLDTIALLCGPRMKLQPKRANAAGEADVDDLHERVTTNIVSHKIKMLVASEVVPPVLALYARVRGAAGGGVGGQLGTYLVRLGADLVREYHAELQNSELADRIADFAASVGDVNLPPNARHLLTHNAPPDPETPRKPKQRRIYGKITKTQKSN